MPEVVVRLGEGEAISRAERREVVVLTERPDISVTWSRYADGERGPDLHVHREHVDAFYVLTGELAFSVGTEGETLGAGAGTFVAVPLGVVHTFANASGGEASWLNFHAPDTGFADFLRAVRDGTYEGGFDAFDPPPDGGRPPAEVIVTSPGNGEQADFGNRVAFTLGVLPGICASEWVLDAAFDAPPVHHHDDKVDTFFVLEGELDLVVEGEAVTAGPGTLASVPRGTRHTFVHDRDGHVRFLNLHTPDAGFSDFLRRS